MICTSKMLIFFWNDYISFSLLITIGYGSIYTIFMSSTICFLFPMRAADQIFLIACDSQANYWILIHTSTDDPPNVARLFVSLRMSSVCRCSLVPGEDLI